MLQRQRTPQRGILVAVHKANIFILFRFILLLSIAPARRDCGGNRLTLPRRESSFYVDYALNSVAIGVTPFFKMMLPYFAVSPEMTTAYAFFARS